ARVRVLVLWNYRATQVSGSVKHAARCDENEQTPQCAQGLLSITNGPAQNPARQLLRETAIPMSAALTLHRVKNAPRSVHVTAVPQHVSQLLIRLKCELLRS